jgi:hypothetical protein
MSKKKTQDSASAWDQVSDEIERIRQDWEQVRKEAAEADAHAVKVMKSLGLPARRRSSSL